MLYKNCRELPMHNFNEVQITNDLTYLVKDDEKHDEEELEKHWIEILDECFKITNDNSQRKFFRDRSELLYLEQKILNLEALKLLSIVDLNEEQSKKFESLKKKYKVSDIEQAILETSDKIKLKLSQFRRLYKTEKNSNFDKSLASMRINGYTVDRYSVTVSEYFEMLDQIKRQAASSGQNKKANHRP